MTAPVITLDDGLATRATTDHDGLGMLTCDEGWLPLTAVDVDATVSGLDAAVTVRQSFVNTLPTAIEATYIHPLPDRAAVTRFVMTVGDRRIEGTLQERGEARATYDQAIAEGHRAAIAEEERPDVFTTRVGNLQPGERADIELTLAQPLPWEEGRALFRFPLVVAPRYIPGRPVDGPQVGEGTALDTDAVPDASRISPPVLIDGLPNPVRLGFRVGFVGGVPRAIDSSLHAVVSDRAVVALRPGERLDRDVVLRWPVATEEVSASVHLVADDDEGADRPGADGDGTFTFVLQPPADSDTTRPRDVVVVLDRSGSMGGWKMVAARRAAARIVDSLQPTDRFAVLAFDHEISTPTTLDTGLVPATNRRRWLAVEWLAGLDARGGTEMVGPLVEATDLLTRTERHDRDAICLLVTDGQVGNEDQLLARLAPKLGPITMFTIGIDRAVNAGLLGRLAAQGGGHCELVESEHRLDEVLTSVHRRITAPVLRSVRITAEGGTVDEVAGGTDCFDGVPLVVRGRYRGPVTTLRWTADGPDGAAVTGTAEAEPVADPAARPLWARARVRDLEDDYAIASADRRLGSGLDDLADRIVELSLATGVLSRFTAFVAVDRSETVDSTAPRPVVQPVEQPAGWDHRSMMAGGPPAMAAPASLSAPPSPAPMPPSPAPMPPTGMAPQRSRRSTGRSRPAPVPMPPSPSAELAQLRRLLARIERGELDRDLRRELKESRKRLEAAGVDESLLVALRALIKALGSRRGHAGELALVRAEAGPDRTPAGHPRSGAPETGTGPAGVVLALRAAATTPLVAYARSPFAYLFRRVA